MSIRIKCPPATLPKEKRIEKLFDDIREWILSPALNELFNLYQIELNYEGNLKKFIHDIHSFASENWDFRKKQAELERFGIKNDSFVIKHEEKVFKCAAELGLMDITEPIFKPDYILPLGGARLTNIARPMMAKKIIDDNSWEEEEIKIVALTGTRPLTKTDFPYLKQYDRKDVCEMSTATKKIYMPNGGQMPERCEHNKKVYKTDIMTEFDAMNLGLEKTFGLSETCTGSYSKNVNINLNSEIREYEDKYGNCSVYSLAVESSDPKKRRANSVDTFNGFVDKFKLNSGDKVLLVTSAIYVPFQGLRFYKLGLELGIDVDCVGVDSSIEGTQFSLATNYLQEIKATIDTIYALSEDYL